MKKLIHMGMLVMLSTAGFAAQLMQTTQQAPVAPAKKVVYSDPSKPLVLSANQSEIKLTLKSNPTTGYGWFWVPLASMAGLIQPVAHHYVAPTNGMMGAPGYEEWVFQVTPLCKHIPTALSVAMRYTRPWEVAPSKPTIFEIYCVPLTG
jgi:predicted secreted protein